MFSAKATVDIIAETASAVSYTHLDVYKRQGKIKGFKIGSCWKIPKKAVDDYIASESGINT